MENEKVNINSVTLEEFIILVKAMRFNQRRFRKSSKQAIKDTLDPLEEKVDDIIARFVERQTELF